MTGGAVTCVATLGPAAMAAAMAKMDESFFTLTRPCLIGPLYRLGPECRDVRASGAGNATLQAKINARAPLYI